MLHENWAGNYRYQAKAVHRPESVKEVQEIVKRSACVKVLGTRHSFNGIADTEGVHVSLDRMNSVIALERERHTVRVEGGIRYGDLCRYLHREGYALPNLASLPHISVAGACATGTHGSGDRCANLADCVVAVDIVTAAGDVRTFSRQEPGDAFDGAVVNLGALGPVVSLTLQLIPAFDVRQEVYQGLPLERLAERFDEVFACGYSVSLFTTWKGSEIDQVWVKRRASDGESSVLVELGATPATAKLHPIPGADSQHCTEQMGIVGPWHERLPHFRLEFTPSAGEELQSEYFVPRSSAIGALRAIEEIRARVAPLLHVSEVRTIAADSMWMSPCYERDSVSIHFTWKKDWEAVRAALPLIEEALAPFEARPHWAKLFCMPPERVRALYPRLPDFRRLALECDPGGKFRNPFLDEYVFGDV